MSTIDGPASDDGPDGGFRGLRAGRAPLIALIGCLALLGVGAGCGDSGSDNPADGDAGAGVDVDGVAATSDGVSAEAQPAGGGAPPFNFAGDGPSPKVDDVFASPADAGEGVMVFADGREAAISLSSCNQFTPDRVSTGRGEFGLSAVGRGETTDGQRFRLEVEHRDGINEVTLITTQDPEVVEAGTSPVWSSLDISSDADGLSLDLRDFWLLATVLLKDEDGPRAISTPVNVGGAVAERASKDITLAEARRLLDDAAEQEADKGLAAKVERLAISCA